MTAPNRFRRQVLLNTLSTGAGNVWAMVVMIVSLPFVLQGMGPTAFGTWVLIQTFSAITGWFALADLGLGTATTRAVATRASLGDEPGVASVISSAMTTFLMLAVVCGGGLALLGPPLLPHVFSTPVVLQDSARTAILLFSVQVLLDMLTEGTEASLEGMQRVDLSRAVDALRRTVVAAATVTVAQTDGRLASVAAASAAASAVGTLAGAAVLRRCLRSGMGRPSWTHIRGLISYAKTVALLQPLGVIRRTMDRLIVGAVIGPAAVALVEIATQIQNGADAVLSATSYAVVPSAAWLDAREDRHTLHELLHRGTKYAVLATVPVAAGAAVLAGPIVRVWVGTRYSAAAGLAVVALLSEIAAAPLQVGVYLLLGIGRARDVVLASVPALVVNLALSLILVHVVGIVGVFIATLVGSAVLTPPILRAMLRAVDSNLRQFVTETIVPALPPLVALLLVAGGVVALDLKDIPTIMLGAIAGGAAYVCVATRWSLDRSEIDELKRLARRRTA